MNPDKAFWLFVTFVTLVFLMGGGSRYDIASVGPLRAVSAIFLAIAISFHTGETLRKVALPVGLLMVLAAWMAVQLIPLPHAWWSGLPGRDEIAQLDSLIGLGEVARPLTLSPMRTLNSLASLVVPLAALMLLALLDGDGWLRLRKLVVIIGIVSAMLGFAQLLVPGASGLYFYEITNNGSAVGLFSNRNHNVLFLNIALLFSFFNMSRATAQKSAAGAVFWLAAQILLVLAVLINGSRFGIVMLALVGAVYVLQSVMLRKHGTRKVRSIGLAGAAVGGLSIVLVIMFAIMDRIPGVQRFFQQSLGDDMRGQSLPYVIELAWDSLPWGMGFGAFEQAYRRVEPVELLGPTYFNQAHNDWLQIIVEGGLAGVLILGIALVCIAWRATQVLRASVSGERDTTLHWLGLQTIALFAMHSAVDYPLRTPSLMVMGAIALGLLFCSPSIADDAWLRRSR